MDRTLHQWTPSIEVNDKGEHSLVMGELLKQQMMTDESMHENHQTDPFIVRLPFMESSQKEGP